MIVMVMRTMTARVTALRMRRRGGGVLVLRVFHAVNLAPIPSPTNTRLARGFMSQAALSLPVSLSSRRLFPEQALPEVPNAIDL